MKSYLQCALYLYCALALCSCDEISQKQNQTPEAKKPESVPELPVQNGRFIPIAPTTGGNVPMVVPWHGFFALDSRTGVLCKTAVHEFPKDEWADKLPLCVGLVSVHDRPYDSHIKSEIEKELDKQLDKDFGKPK